MEWGFEVGNKVYGQVVKCGLSEPKESTLEGTSGTYRSLQIDVEPADGGAPQSIWLPKPRQWPTGAHRNSIFVDWLHRLEKVPELEKVLKEKKDEVIKSGQRVTAEAAFKAIEGLWLKFEEQQFEVPNGQKGYMVPVAVYPTRVACDKAREEELIADAGEEEAPAEIPPETLELAAQNWEAVAGVTDEEQRIAAFKASMGDAYTPALLDAVRG